MTPGSLIQFGEVLKGPWAVGLVRELGQIRCIWDGSMGACRVEGKVSEISGKGSLLITLKSLDLGTRELRKGQEQVCVLSVC